MRTLFMALVLGLVLTGCSLFGDGSGSSQTPNQQISATREMPPPREREEGEQPLLIMLDLTGDGLNANELNTLSQRLWFSLLRTGHFLMVPREHMPRLLAENQIYPQREPLSQMMIGRILRCDYLFTGQVGKVGETYILDSQILDVATGSVIGVGSVTVRGQLEDVVQRLPAIARSLVQRFEGSSYQVSPRSSMRGEPIPEPRAPDVRAMVQEEAPAMRVAPDPMSEEPVSPPEPAQVPEPMTTPMAVSTPEEPAVDSNPTEPVPAVEPVEVTEEPVVEAPAEPAPPAWEDERPASISPSGEQEVEFEPEPTPASVQHGQGPLTEEQQAFISPTATTRQTVDEPVAPSAEGRIAQASADLERAIEDFTNPYGELNSDIGAADDLVRQASSYAADDKMHAQLLEQALELEPQNPETLFSAAVAHFHQQEYSKTRDECLASLHLHPVNAAAFTVLGSAHHLMGEFPMAVAAHRRALEIEPNNHFAQYNMALSLAEIDPAQAIQAFERFIELANGVAGQADFVERAQTQIEELTEKL